LGVIQLHFLTKAAEAGPASRTLRLTAQVMSMGRVAQVDALPLKPVVSGAALRPQRDFDDVTRLKVEIFGCRDLLPLRAGLSYDGDLGPQITCSRR
jgi:hypothetical protein